MRIQKIEFNWFYDTVNGEQVWSYTVGVNGCLKIDAHFPSGLLEPFYCSAIFEDGREELIFNVNKIIRIKE